MTKKKSTRGGVIRKVPKETKEIKEPKETKEKTEDEIVYHYIEKLKKQVDEKELSSYVIFLDTGFADKMKNITFTDLKKIMKKNPKKYAGRKMAHIVTKVRLPDEHVIEMKKGILIFCDIFTAHIDDKGNIDDDTIAHTNILWEKKHLKISKYSLKLIEKLTRIIIRYKFNHVLFCGTPLNLLVDLLERKKIDLSDYLSPLKGL